METIVPWPVYAGEDLLFFVRANTLSPACHVVGSSCSIRGQDRGVDEANEDRRGQGDRGRKPGFSEFFSSPRVSRKVCSIRFSLVGCWVWSLRRTASLGVLCGGVRISVALADEVLGTGDSGSREVKLIRHLEPANDFVGAEGDEGGSVWTGGERAGCSVGGWISEDDVGGWRFRPACRSGSSCREVSEPARGVTEINGERGRVCREVSEAAGGVAEIDGEFGRGGSSEKWGNCIPAFSGWGANSSGVADWKRVCTG